MCRCSDEESKPQFLDRLQTGYYWEEPSTTGPITCLWIGGDGCYGCRVFMLTPEQELYVLNDDWEDASRYDCLYHYNRSENCLKLIRDDVPKSILNVDAVAYPSRVWQTLFPER